MSFNIYTDLREGDIIRRVGHDNKFGNGSVIHKQGELYTFLGYKENGNYNYHLNVKEYPNVNGLIHMFEFVKHPLPTIFFDESLFIIE